MVNIKLTRNKGFKWFHQEGIYAKGYLFDPDGILHRDENICSYFNAKSRHKEDFRQALLSANGVFSVIIQRENQVWIAVDRFRFFPLFYREKEECLYLSDEVDSIYRETGDKKEVDPDSALIFSSCGYVLGNKTLLKDTFQVQAGEFIAYENKSIVPVFYHKLFSEINDLSFEEAASQLKKIFRNASKRMVQLIDNRQVILPLSGGLDSRLIAYFLKKEGVQNVICFTYGREKGNPEWERSKNVAEKLGFDWKFIDYTKIDDLEYYKKPRFIDFYNYEAQYTSKFGLMLYFSSEYLIDCLKIPAHSVILPGHGGDFFSGSHYKFYMKNYDSLQTIANDLEYIHCNLVKLSRKERKKIYVEVKKGLESDSPLFANVVNWDLKERQAKYIINSCAIWGYSDFETQMPLCDTELMDFFASLPFDYLLGQKLYRTVVSDLFEEFDINFPQDSLSQNNTAFIQKLKTFFKRRFPFLRRKANLFQFDYYYDYERFVQPILKELEESSLKNRKITASNGIFAQWYLMQVYIKNKTL